jgi:hypothetical protein
MSSQEPEPNKAAWLQDIDERCRNMAEITRQRESAQMIQLPLWHEGKSGSPNSFSRSALFAAVQYKKGRALVKNELIFSQQNLNVKYTGEKLNQEDMTVWLALIHMARQHPLGNECSFTAYGILKHMGLKNGGEQSERLRLSVERMTACMVKIETSKFIYGGSLIEKFVIDKDTKHYKIILSRDLIKLFGENDWTALNWEQRIKLKHKPLALSLQDYYSGNEFPRPVGIQFLHDKTGSNNGQLRDFKRKLKTALGELVKVGFLESFSIEKNLVTVKRIYKAPVSQRYLGG